MPQPYIPGPEHFEDVGIFYKASAKRLSIDQVLTTELLDIEFSVLAVYSLYLKYKGESSVFTCKGFLATDLVQLGDDLAFIAGGVRDHFSASGVITGTECYNILPDGRMKRKSQDGRIIVGFLTLRDDEIRKAQLDKWSNQVNPMDPC